MSQNLAAKAWFNKLFQAVGQSAWVLLGLFGFTYAAFSVLFALIPERASHYLIGTTPGYFTLVALQYIITLSVVVGVPLALWRRSRRESFNLKQLLGVANLPRLKYLLIIPFVWVAYLAVTSVMSMLASFIPGFDVTQAQNIGFENLVSYWELALAFVALVILAPLAEELLFRGYLFGKLREVSGFWPSAIVTSIVFGIAHQQWNVGLDVAVLSMFLCALRERSGSIWAGIGLHAFKNAIAYFVLFIAPLLGLNLLQ